MNKLAPCIAEAIGTFALIFIGIGLTIAIGILFAGLLTGGAINPARVFGPALAVSNWTNHYVYWIGPLLGGAAAGWVYTKFLLR